MEKFDLNGSTFLITGGTGSFGTSMLSRLIRNPKISEIRIFSRDELKQEQLRTQIDDARVKYWVGDTRDYARVREATLGSDFVFHAAALKQVPTGEFFPFEMVKTNIIGSENVIRASIEANVASVVCLSTDKAVYPINSMGVSKAMMERLAISRSRETYSQKTKITVTRYGNVMCSRGSVIPRFLEQLSAGTQLTITDSNMTRFLMSLDNAIDLVLHSLQHADPGDLHVMKAPAATISTLAQAISTVFDKKRRFNSNIIGVRHGEKKHESLMSAEELMSAVDENDFFKVPVDSRGMKYEPYFVKGAVKSIPEVGFTSANTTQLTLDETISLLCSNSEFIKLLEGLK
jgi:UDP-N-acetylglucosamine 4,6-dehydratase